MKVLVRLDDFTPNRNVERWRTLEAILDRLGVAPLVACIPNDKYFGTKPSTEEFWTEARRLDRKGWTLALHGETHCVTPIAAGVPHEVFFAEKAEFVGLSEEDQLQKLNRAWQLFVEHGLQPRVFVAPNHGFDRNTIGAIRKQRAMTVVSDGVSWRAFRDRGLLWLPQIDWRMPRLRFGCRTVCLHPSTMEDAEMRSFDIAAHAARRCFVTVADLETCRVAERSALDRLFAAAFKFYFNAKSALHALYSPGNAKKATTPP